MRYAWFYIALFFYAAMPVNSQDVDISHGVTVSISFPRSFRALVSYNMHIRSHVPMVSEWALTPMADIKFSLFHRHLGSSVLKKYRAPLYSNISLSYGLLVSQDFRNSENPGMVPVFTNVYQNNFNTGMEYNLGLGSTHSWQIALGKDSLSRPVLHQKIGNFMLGVQDFYMTYYNDGGPILHYFGDGEDRYWTGGLTVGYLHRVPDDIHQFEVSFDKFTGFSKNAFEATGLLQVDNVLYKEIEQFSYNTGRLGIKYLNHKMGLGISGNVWNLPVDLQDYIHRDISNNPYHHKIEKLYYDLEAYKRWDL